jgi:hypothetical protein
MCCCANLRVNQWLNQRLKALLAIARISLHQLPRLALLALVAKAPDDG